MKRLLQVSLQIKILGLVISLLLLVIGILTAMFVIMETNEDVVQAEDLALQTAKTLSYMPVVQQAFQSDKPKKTISPIAKQIREEVGASSIKVKNREGMLYSNAMQDKTDLSSPSKDNYRSLVFGSYYVTHSGEGEEEVLKGIAPVFIDYGAYGKIEGTVTVGFNMQEIHQEIASDTRKMMVTSAVVLLMGILGGIVLARSIRRDTLGLEPVEIASLYRERSAIIQSVKEGIIAIDQKGIITMMNISAQHLLGIPKKIEGLSISEVFSSVHMLDLLNSDKEQVNVQLQHIEKTIIVNAQPILDGGKKVGTVANFRDKTEIKKMVDALSEVKQYSEDLRAQTHEFTNKLYVLLGLIQLGKQEEAMELIQEEAKLQELHTDLVFNSIHDEKVQAILLGKLAKASEKKIEFVIEDSSSLSPLSARIDLMPLIVIIGNLIDNAFEAVSENVNKQVSFFVTDIGNDVIFEIADNGKGIQKGKEGALFKKGFSLKGKNRGYGLANVKEEVELLGGSIEFVSNESDGTVFTVFLPKKM